MFIQLKNQKEQFSINLKIDLIEIKKTNSMSKHIRHANFML